jgi:hypothetical protein
MPREPAQRVPGDSGPLAGAHWTEQLVRWLDDGLRVPGTQLRFGLDALVGLFVPGAGDAITAVGALALFYDAWREGVPKRVLARMALNVAVDLVVGAVPVAGDAFDLVWKANRKNLQLIERHRREPAAPARWQDYFVLAGALALMMMALAIPVVLLTLGVGWALSLF